MWRDAHTMAAGLRVPHAFADYLILRIIRDSGGTAVAVTDAEIIDAVGELARLEGLFVCPEGAASLAAFKRLAASGFLNSDERVVLFNTGSGLKYADLIRYQAQLIDPSDSTAVDALSQVPRTGRPAAR
jgi:threonine synthase